jgi:uncharacterized protein with PQ loop repeat
MNKFLLLCLLTVSAKNKSTKKVRPLAQISEHISSSMFTYGICKKKIYRKARPLAQIRE